MDRCDEILNDLPPGWQLLSRRVDPEGRETVKIESDQLNLVIEGSWAFMRSRALSYTLSPKQGDR